jgi:PAS domain S-box-containing protein
VRHLHSESRFEFDTAGKPINLFGITQDVTHVKKIEAELHKSELNIHTIFETTNVGFILTDTSFKIVTSNSVINTWAKDLMGFDLVTGGSLRDILPPKRFGEFENMMGLILQGEQVSYEMEYPVANGAAKWFHMNGKQVKEINGKASGICLAVNDVTERKKAEKAITDSETRLKKAEQISHMGNWELNFADSMLSLSDEGARIFGFPPEQNHLSYQKWTELVPPEDLESVLCLIKESKVALKDTNFHHRIVLKDGTVKHILSESKFKMDETGKPTGLYGITQDVTERKEAERKIKELNENLELRIQERTTELTKANAALEAFSYSVSHDLRAPVRTIMSFSNLIQKNFSDTMEPGAKELFTFIDDGSKRMNDIIDNLLKFAKYGKDKLNLVPLNMTKTVQGVWLNLCRNAPNNAVLEVEELQVAHVDRLMMEQVIVNLLSNAVKYSSKKAKPVIKVWCEQADENVTFYFRDNGAGFDMKNYERLFGAFQRLHNNTEFAGNGVGLMLVKSILEKHGGTVGAEGKVNEGATFYFTLPRFSE